MDFITAKSPRPMRDHIEDVSSEKKSSLSNRLACLVGTGE
eukprot:CAMPEP_0183572666 /NCGR_PEP_ID=MMETSP0371-20130417/129079_1 /TAXON_ID=268820 /ORGANISM="Peridinium aciculiferum, Strain PAER-2" /LENGTH=39 /DNA_ID= /DNA_START= /DNA_END= /DNA_ORIENTATION=